MNTLKSAKPWLVLNFNRTGFHQQKTGFFRIRNRGVRAGMSRIGGVVLLAFFLSENASGQSGLCSSAVPYFTVNLTGQPDGYYISPSIARNNLCCTASNPDRCIEFQIMLDPAAVGINFEIYSGAQPPGALYYQINCGPQIPVGQQICLSGAGPHTLTFCKPGNNKNQYRITSIKGYTRAADVTTVEDCYTDLHVTGLVENTIVWRDITGGGYYENFLSCASGCSNALFTTASGFPPSVDFEVCGKIYSSVCQSIMQTICDTIRVHIEPAMEISYTPEPAAFCEEDSSRLMNVAILPRKSTYIIRWMSGPDGTGNILGNDTFYYAQASGNYSIVVVDTEFAFCSSDTINIPIVFIPPPSVVTAPKSASVCQRESVTLTASGAVSYLWSPAFTLSCSECASPTASPAVSTAYIVTGTDSFGCFADDTTTITVIQPKYTSLTFSICDGDSVTVGSSVYDSAGTYQDTLTASAGCDSIVTSTIQIRNNFFTLIDTVICSGSGIIVGNSMYSVPGTYFDTMAAFNGCDSIVETHLAIHPVNVCDNPDLTPCPQRIIFVLDESGSISGIGGGGVTNISAQVRNAAAGLISSLEGTNAQVAVVEFNSTARRAVIGGLSGYQPVNSTYVASFNAYIAQDANTTGSNSNYDPEDYSCTVPQSCYTNWEDAFEEVQSINTSLGLAQLVIFFTDGQPTAYNNSWGSVTVGTGAAAVAQALAEATAAANNVQIQGSHIFVIGLPNTMLPETNVQQISGLERFPDMQQSFLKADYTISSSSQLVNSVAGIAQMMCQADLRLNIQADDTVSCAGSNVVFTIIVTNDGSGRAAGVEVKNHVPSGYAYVSDDGGTATAVAGSIVTWAVGNLNNGESDTLRITAAVNVSGDYKNVAEVSASNEPDPDSTPNNDDGDQSEDDEDAAIVSVLNCNDGNPCTTDACTSGNCTHTYTPASCSIAGNNSICFGETTEFIATGGAFYSWTGPNGFSHPGANTGAISQSGTYSVTVADASGCTNTCSVALAVKSNPSCSITGDDAICPSESSWLTASGGVAYSWSGPDGFTANTATIAGINMPGDYFVTITGTNGCSSACWKTLAPLTPSLTEITDTVCSGTNYLLASKSYTDSGTYYDTLTAMNGCDSILKLHLAVIPLSYRTVDFTICQGDSIVIGSSVYYSSGVYYDTFMSSHGCDSIVLSSIHVSNHSQTVHDVTICTGESYSAGGSAYSSSGVYFDTLPTVNGCDSIIQTNLLVLPVCSTVIDTTICANESFAVGVSNYATSGTYYDTLTSAGGCDSIVISTIRVLNHSRAVNNVTICNGESYSAGGSTYSSSGVYFDTIIAATGCDSIIQTNLLVISPLFDVIDTAICAGESIRIGTKNYSAAGTFIDTLISSNGCDSIVITRLKVRPVKFSTLVVSICTGDSVVLGNTVYHKSGTYLHAFKTSRGCDSLLQLQLQVWPQIGGAQDRMMCEGATIQFNLTGGIQYEWVPATGLSCANCANPSASPADDISYIIRVTDMHQCVGYDTIHVDVSKVKASFVASDDEVCEGEAIAFSENFVSDYPLQSRMWDFGDGFITTNRNPVHAYFEDGTFRVRLTVTNSVGCTESDDTTVTIHLRPEMLINADTAICIGDSVRLYASGADAYAWLPSNYLNNPDIPAPLAKPVADIQYHVIGISANGCLNHAAVNIRVHPLPALWVSPDAAVCPNASAALYATGGTRYAWSPPDGLSNPSAQFVIASPSASTTYHVTAFNQFGCMAADSVKVEVFPKTEFKVSPDGEICRGDKLTLSARGAHLYRWTPPAGLSCDACEVTLASPAVSTHYTVAATDTYGCKYHDSVSVMVREIPYVRTIPDITICKGETVVLQTNASPITDLRWYPESGLNNPHTISPAASPAASTTFVVSVSNAYGCKNSDSVRVNVLSKVEAGLLGSEACPGERIRLEAHVNKASANGFSIAWSPPVLFDDVHASAQLISPNHDTEVSVIVTSQTCEADTATYFIHVHDPPQVDAGPDKTVYLGEPVLLSAFSPSVIHSYQWTPADRLDCSECPLANWIADKSQKFYIRVMNEHGCLAIDSVLFRVVGNCTDDIYIPNAFTPNGDEINDALLVRSLNPIRLEHFKIFDRWGNEVYSSGNIEAGWNGLYAGREAAAGVYVYHLKASCRNGQRVFLKGNVTLIR